MAFPAVLAAAGMAAGKSLLSNGMNWLGHYVTGEIDDYFWNKRFDKTSAFQLNLMQKQHEYALKFEKDKYLAQVEGMKAAGINPAITSAFSMGWTARN